MNKKLNTYFIALILNSYAQLAPENPKYLADLGPELHDRLCLLYTSDAADE